MTDTATQNRQRQASLAQGTDGRAPGGEREGARATEGATPGAEREVGHAGDDHARGADRAPQGAGDGHAPAAERAPQGGGPEPQIGRAGVGLAFAALVLAMLPAVLDQTILATALPTIAGDLGRLTDVSLLVTAYVVAATASTPLWGKLGDRQGRKRMLQIDRKSTRLNSSHLGISY